MRDRVAERLQLFVGRGQLSSLYLQTSIQFLNLLLCPLPLYDSSQSLDDGLQQTLLFCQEGSLIPFPSFFQIVHLQTSLSITMNRDIRCQPPAGLAEVAGGKDSIPQNKAHASYFGILQAGWNQVDRPLKYIFQGSPRRLYEPADAVEAVQLLYSFVQIITPLAQFLLRPLARGDVTYDTDPADAPALPIRQGRDGVLSLEDYTVLPFHLKLRQIHKTLLFHSRIDARLELF